MTVRGIRNMNPGNIRLGESWLGLRMKQTDPDFCQFTSMIYGCRALLKLLRTYVEKRGCTTIRKVVERWAPPLRERHDELCPVGCGRLPPGR